MIQRIAVSLVLAALAAIWACDEPSGPQAGPPATVAGSDLPGSATVGQTVTGVTVTVEDAEGRPLEDVLVTWSANAGGAADPAEVRTGANGAAGTQWTLGTAVGMQTLTAAVDGVDPVTFTMEAEPDRLDRLSLVHDRRVLHALNDTLVLETESTDQYGNEVPIRTLFWTSNDTAVVTVEEGVVTARGVGSAVVQVSGAIHFDTVTIEVDQVVAGLALTPQKPRVLILAESLQLTATAVDSGGSPVDTVVTPEWASSAEEVATVTGDGLVDAVGTGEAVVTASAGPYEGVAALDVRTGPRPTITGMAPEVAEPGGELIITGTGFSAVASDNAVFIAGVEATVLSAAPGELTVRVAESGFPCAPTGPVPVVAAVSGLEAAADHPLAPARQRPLAVGESVALGGDATACNELTEPGRYLVSVVNAAVGPSGVSSFRLRGSAPSAMADARTDRPRRRTIRVPTGAPPLPAAPGEVAHLRIMERNLQLAEELRRHTRPGAASRRRDAVANLVPEVGDIMEFRVPDVEAFNACASYHQVAARVAHVGERSIVLEDTLAPLAGQMNDTWQQIGEEMDDVMFQILLDYFGDPLILDQDLDANERFLMLFTPRVNDFEGNIAGFVYSGDLFPRTGAGGCASSDEAEMFYGYVPTSLEEGFSESTRDSWYWSMRSTVIHEAKHITSLANRLHKGGTFLGSMWEEPTARLAEEFYGRAVYGYGQNDNTGYQESIYCEYRPGWDECLGSPYVMGKHFDAVSGFYQATEQRSPLGPAFAGDGTFYGSGWLLIRWAVDHSGQDEAAFVKALVQETELAGVDNLAARTGRPFPELLADFSLAMAADDHPDFVPHRAENTFPSWNTADIFRGQSQDFSQFPATPLEPRTASFGDFDLLVAQVQGGGMSFIELSGTMDGTQLLELQDYEGGPAPDDLRLAILRIE